MSTIGERIKEERQRLGLGQVEFGKIGGCGRTTQFKYEANESKPDTEYLERIGKIGADLVYIVTGYKASTDNIYTETGEALNAVLDVQGELGLSFTAEQIKNLIELAWKYQMNREQLKASVLSSYEFRNLEPPVHKSE